MRRQRPPDDMMPASGHHAYMEEDTIDDKPSKRTRISAACSFCRSRKSRCDGKQPCGHCVASNQFPCIYPPKSRKVDAEYVAELEAKARYLEELQQQTPLALQTSQFASGPLPLPRNIGQHQHHHFSSPIPQHYAVASSSVRSGLGTLAEAAIGDHEGVPPHFANKQSPGVLPLSIAEIPPDPVPSSSRPATRDGPSSGREGVALIAHDYSGGASTTGLAGRVQNAMHRLMGSNGTENAVSARPAEDPSAGQPHNNRFIFEHSANPEDLYILPHRPLADQLLQIYRDHVHIVFPIFHWPTLEEKYLAVWRARDAIDTDLLGILNLIFATASLFVHEGILPKGRAWESGLRFYKRALKIMYPLVLASESIAGLQCMILMTYYLQFSPEAQLCWTTSGNCIRVAQCRGFHVPSTTEHMNPIDREVRRRIWGACVQLDSMVCVTLGFASSLSASECLSVEPLLVDDQYVSQTGASQPPNTPSVIACFVESNKLAALRVEAVNQLYTTKDASTSTMPDVHAILALDQSLAEVHAKFPAFLALTEAGRALRQNSQDLIRQATVLDIRYLGLKMLIHRPLLFYLCSRGQMDDKTSPPASPLHDALARASAELCAEAAVSLIKQCLDGYREAAIVCWAVQIYYIHSAALVLLAARIVDENDERRGQTKHKIVDAQQIDALLARAVNFMAQMADENGSSEVPAALSSGPARKTARRCRAMLLKISEGLNIAVSGRKGGNSPAASSVPSQHGATDDRYEDYARAFLELVPNGAASGYDSAMGDPQTMMGQWSTQDLLTANSLPTNPGYLDGVDAPAFQPVPMFGSQPSQTGWSTSPSFGFDPVNGI